jgi:formylglycine-generating enzyme required for sulfatase activity
VSLEMVKIPGGRFLMGSPDTEAERFDTEGPQHYVHVPEFWMGKYVVTQGQWKEIACRTDLKVELDLKTDPSSFKEPYNRWQRVVDRVDWLEAVFKKLYKGIDRWQRPVDEVNWFEAVEFCRRLSKLIGRNYRLPSEAEWEYACRAGTTTPFYFGETINTDLANYCGTDHKRNYWSSSNGSGSYGDGPKGEDRRQTTPVGQFPANAFGLYDMHGNVWEWCADKCHKNYAGAPTDGSVWRNGNEPEPSSPLRGGSSFNGPTYCRSAIRNLYTGRDVHYIVIGFRLVCDGGRTL